MSECEICDMLGSGKLKKVYEDDKVIAVLCPEPVSQGHVWVMPKKHYTIIEHVPDFEVAHIFGITNKVSISLFEVLQVQGTNIFIQNGVAAGQKHNHFLINIIPRMPDDNVKLDWQPKQLTEEEMSTVELKIRDQTKTVGYFEEEKPEPVNLDKSTEKYSDEENYLVKHLRKIP